jgi:hypothetical protein
MHFKKIKNLRNIIIVFGLAAVLLITAAGVTISYFLPDIIKSRLEHQLAQITGDTVTIESVKVSISEAVNIKGLKFYDINNRQWLGAEKIKAAIKMQRGFHFSIQEIGIEGLKLQLLAVDNRISLPFKIPSKASGESGDKLDLQKFTVKDSAVIIEYDKGLQTVYDNISLNATHKTNSSFDFSLSNSSSKNADESLDAQGTIDLNNLNTNTSFKLKHQFTKQELSLIFNANEMNIIPVDCNLTADIRLAGSLSKPYELLSGGTVQLHNCILAKKDTSEQNTINTNITFLPSGIHIDNLKIIDSSNLELLKLDNADLRLAGWPGKNPTLTELETDNLVIVGRNIDGRFSLDGILQPKQSDNTKSDYTDLKKILLNNTSIALAQNPEDKIIFGQILLQQSQKENWYDLKLTATNSPDANSNIINLDGAVNPAEKGINVAVNVDHYIQKQVAAVAFAAIGLPQTNGQGRLLARITVSGSWDSPANLKSNGTVDFNQWEIFQDNQLLADNFTAAAIVNNQIFDVNQFTANVCNGPVKGTVHGEILQNQSVMLSVRIAADKMSYSELANFWGVKTNKTDKGTVTLNSSFNADTNDLQSIRAAGEIFFDNIDITIIPIVPEIFNSVGLAKVDPATVSYVTCSFNMSGPVMDITSAHIANPLGAIEVEPGGKIDIQSGNLDLYVVAVPLRQLVDLPRNLPVVDIAYNLRDKLTRLYIKGNWSSPPAKLITKTPIKDIKEGTIGFFSDIIKNGDNIGQVMLKGLKSILSIGQKENAK